MKKIVLFSLIMALPCMALAQNDDLYFIPKKKTEKKEKVTTPAKVVVKQEQAPVSVNTAPVSSTIVVKDVNGNVRDVDEYNRRYTSRDNSFSYENDTLYIEEKPYNERGEWINGFEGSQMDYDYAMRIIRFRNPSYAVHISSPLYWDIMSLGYSSDWNVFDSGFYVYAFPTYTNHWWWDWRFNYTWRHSYYWCYPSNYWGWYGSGYYWGGYYPPHIHHSHWHHFPPHYAHGGVGGYWGPGHGWNGSSAHNLGIHSGRYTDNHRRESFPARDQVGRSERNSRNDYVNTRRNGQNSQTVNRNNGHSVRSSSGRVVTSRDGVSSVRPQRSSAKARSGQAVSAGASNTRSSSVYTRQVQGRSSSYNRASSTRSTVTNSGSWNGRSGGNYYNGASSSGRSGGGGSYSSGSSRSSSSSASYSSGGSSGAGRSASNGGTSRGSGGRR